MSGWVWGPVESGGGNQVNSESQSRLNRFICMLSLDCPRSSLLITRTANLKTFTGEASASPAKDSDNDSKHATGRYKGMRIIQKRYASRLKK